MDLSLRQGTSRKTQDTSEGPSLSAGLANAEYTLNVFLPLSAAQCATERCDDTLACPIGEPPVLEKKVPGYRAQHNMERTLHEFYIAMQ